MQLATERNACDGKGATIDIVVGNGGNQQSKDKPFEPCNAADGRRWIAAHRVSVSLLVFPESWQL